jgi:hypothetical protein
LGSVGGASKMGIFGYFAWFLKMAHGRPFLNHKNAVSAKHFA